MSAEWTIEGESDGQYIHGEYGGADVYITVEVSAIGTPPTFREHVDIEQAPLHLVRAAPLMLEALEIMVQRHPCECVVKGAGCCSCEARAALDAARGESPDPGEDR